MVSRPDLHLLFRGPFSGAQPGPRGDTGSAVVLLEMTALCWHTRFPSWLGTRRINVQKKLACGTQ